MIWEKGRGYRPSDLDSCRPLLAYVAGGIRVGECFLVAESPRVASDEASGLNTQLQRTPWNEPGAPQ